jgi:NAD(P)-dependent dehydrogenase (short-subunit alcohol dehydrogenase family)
MTDDGIELTFAVNHLAPFLLTHDLLDGFEPAASTRVVVVGSNAHRAASIDPDRVARPRRYEGLRAYNQSKLANELFVRALAARLVGRESGAYVVDPGLVNTAIGTKHSGPLSSLVWHFRRRLGTAPDVPARTIAALVTGELGEGESGTTWRDGRRIEPSAHALDERLAENLWRVSCELGGVAASPVPREPVRACAGAPT